MSKTLVAAIPVALGSFFGGAYLSEKAAPFHIDFVTSKFVDSKEVKLLLVEGLLVPLNYKPGSPFQFFHIRCDQEKFSCLMIDGPVSGSPASGGLLMRLNVNDPEVLSYDEKTITLQMTYLCRRENWTINRVLKTATMESFKIASGNDNPNCANVGTETRRAFIGNSADLKAAGI